jgi:putative membrane protein
MLGLATSPPLEALAHADARGHMAQHLLLGMYAPLALVLGAPLTLLLGSIPLPPAGPLPASSVAACCTASATRSVPRC